MDILSILFIAIGVSLDCFAVAIAGSITIKHISHHQIWRASIIFGISQSAMLTIGWLAGQAVVNFIESFANWLAFGLLLLIGIKMIRESFESEKEDRTDITKGIALLLLAVATSIDSFAVGLSLAFLDSGVLTGSITIGIICCTISAVGFYSGKKIGSLIGRRAEILGGLVLIAIGFRTLLTEIL